MNNNTITHSSHLFHLLTSRKHRSIQTRTNSLFFFNHNELDQALEYNEHIEPAIYNYLIPTIITSYLYNIHLFIHYKFCYYFRAFSIITLCLIWICVFNVSRHFCYFPWISRVQIINLMYACSMFILLVLSQLIGYKSAAHRSTVTVLCFTDRGRALVLVAEKTIRHSN